MSRGARIIVAVLVGIGFLMCVITPWMDYGYGG